MTITVDQERCKGCKYCIKFCPKGAISPSGAINDQGVEFVQVDSAKCIGCGTCYAVCPDLVFRIN